MVYDLYGNGNDIHYKSDEGFFIYSNQIGSWSLSEKLTWINPDDVGPTEAWQKAGQMVREIGSHYDSPYFFSFMTCGLEKSYGKFVSTGWRNEVGQFADSNALSTHTLQKPENSIFLRVTRIVDFDLFYSEWSLDGQTWTVNDFSIIDMKGESPLIWRFWDNADGLEQVNRRWLSVNSNGSVITIDRKMSAFSSSRIDGYNVNPNFIKNTPHITESAFGDIWSASKVKSELKEKRKYDYFTLRQYQNGGWNDFAVDIISPVSGPLHFIPGATDQVYLHTQDQIFEFNAATQQTKYVKSIKSINKYPVPMYIYQNSVGSDGTYWIFGEDKLFKMILPTLSNSLTAYSTEIGQ